MSSNGALCEILFLRAFELLMLTFIASRHKWFLPLKVFVIVRLSFLLTLKCFKAAYNWILEILREMENLSEKKKMGEKEK